MMNYVAVKKRSKRKMFTHLIYEGTLAHASRWQHFSCRETFTHKLIYMVNFRVTDTSTFQLWSHVLNTDWSVGGLSRATDRIFGYDRHIVWSLSNIAFMHSQSGHALMFVWPPRSHRWPREGWECPSTGSLKWPSLVRLSASSQNASHVQTLEPCRNRDHVSL